MQQWLPGHKLKNRPYEILQEIGQGGFGITYKAKNLSLDVPVVIKTPNSRLQRDKNYSKYLQSFKKEAKQLAKLGMNPHPHIVRVFDFFAEENLPCIVMDYVPGNSVYDLVQMNGVLSEKKALEYIRQIGSALEVCHKQGIIHRDVHPNNILIHAESGKGVLIDFGISGSTQTSRSNHSGNQAFAPWEQLISFGEQTSKTPQVDIYTLAASFYYLVTGDTPTPGLARKFNNDDLIEPKQHNPLVSDRINQAILKGMAIEPGDRPKMVKDWLEMLNQPKSKPELLVSPKPTIKSKLPVIKGAELRDTQVPPKPKVTLPNSAEQTSTKNTTIVKKNQNDTKTSNINYITSPQPKKKLPLLLIFGILIAGLGIFGIVGYQVISNRTKEPEPETTVESLAQLPEQSKAKNYELDNLVQTLEAQYQTQKYQECYNLATQKTSLDQKVVSDWIGKCGLALASSKASLNSFSSAISIADTIPKEASNYQEVRENINLWSENILEYATIKYKEGNLEEAIKITQLIDDKSSVGTRILDLETQWRKEQEEHQTIINNAQQALEQEQWQDAKEEGAKIADEFISWKKQAQVIINTANYELNKLDLQARQQEEEEVSPQQQEEEVSPQQQEEEEISPQQQEEEEISPQQQQEEVSLEEEEISPQQQEEEVNPQQQEEEVSPQQEEEEVSPQQEEEEVSPQQEEEEEVSPQQQEEEVSPQQEEEEEVSPQQEEEEVSPQQEEEEISPQQEESVYKIKAGDSINIDIFQVEEYSGDYSVLSNGSIDLPLVGNVSVEGLTLQEASDLIGKEYSTYLKKPVVTVELTNPASSVNNEP